VPFVRRKPAIQLGASYVHASTTSPLPRVTCCERPGFYVTLRGEREKIWELGKWRRRGKNLIVSPAGHGYSEAVHFVFFQGFSDRSLRKIFRRSDCAIVTVRATREGIEKASSLEMARSNLAFLTWPVQN
jgi:hypothetical protein